MTFSFRESAAAPIIVTIALVGGLLALSACADSSSARSADAGASGDVAAGKTIAKTYCSSCHAIGSRGQSPHHEAPPFRTLSQRYPIDFLAESFAEGLRSGHPDMPEFRFEPEPMNDLLAYLKSVQPKTGS